jgi:hypothetical protein
MEDVYNIIRNLERIYSNNTSFQVLKDFERVLDEINLYIYDNWFEGEVASGPHIERHWITVRLVWPREKMPDPEGGKKLVDYGCKVSYIKSSMIKPRKIRKPSDLRPGTKKGKLDREPIWIVEIKMPKRLVADIYSGYFEQQEEITEPTKQEADTLDAAAPDLEANTGGGAEGLEDTDDLI